MKITKNLTVLLLGAVIVLSTLFGTLQLFDNPKATEKMSSKIEITTTLNKTELSANEKLTADFTFNGKVNKKQ